MKSLACNSGFAPEFGSGSDKEQHSLSHAVIVGVGGRNVADKISTDILGKTDFNSLNVLENDLVDSDGYSLKTHLTNGGGHAFLGTNANLPAVVENTEVFDRSTGEVFSCSPPHTEVALARANRFILQSVVKNLLPSSRTAKCLRWPQSNKAGIDVYRSLQHQTASFGGLQTCGSVWIDPVCAAKISERRRNELQQAVDQHHYERGCMFMLTLTAPHQFKDTIGDLLVKHKNALHKFLADWSVNQVLKAMEVLGTVKALEVTHGRKRPVNNGWHPHHHDLLFAGSKGSADKFTFKDTKNWSDELYRRWAACCVAAGLGLPTQKHGLKLDDATLALHYITKWGVDDELVKGHTKKSNEGETPWDFLRAVLADPNDKHAGQLFVEFATAFRGKRQLTWSKGLKAHFGIGEVSDECLAEKLEASAIYLGSITIEQWRAVLKVEGRVKVLELAEGPGGWDSVQEYLSSLS